MARKSGSVTIGLLASVALALSGCMEDKDEEGERDQASGSGYHGPIFFGSSGKTGLRSDASQQVGADSAPNSVSRGGFGSTGSTRSVYS
ncbi:MAG: hypothetical protein SGI88_05630 [Candidatus Hydrogenedentes bacterium]|nr:hypothetical protein [Candidatus Hydrogenedentota bacterium]